MDEDRRRRRQAVKEETRLGKGKRITFGRHLEIVLEMLVQFHRSEEQNENSQKAFPSAIFSTNAPLPNTRLEAGSVRINSVRSKKKKKQGTSKTK